MNWFKKQFGKFFEKNKPKEFDFVPEQAPDETEEPCPNEELPLWTQKHEPTKNFIVTHHQGYVNRLERRRRRAVAK